MVAWPPSEGMSSAIDGGPPGPGAARHPLRNKTSATPPIRDAAPARTQQLTTSLSLWQCHDLQVEGAGIATCQHDRIRGVEQIELLDTFHRGDRLVLHAARFSVDAR